MFLVFLLLHLALVEFSVLIANLDVFISLRNYVAEVDWKFRVFLAVWSLLSVSTCMMKSNFFTFLSYILARHFNGLYLLSYCSLIFACHYLIPSGRCSKMRRGSWSFLYALVETWNWIEGSAGSLAKKIRFVGNIFLWESINIVCLHISNSLCI